MSTEVKDKKVVEELTEENTKIDQQEVKSGEEKNETQQEVDSKDQTNGQPESSQSQKVNEESEKRSDDSELVEDAEVPELEEDLAETIGEVVISEEEAEPVEELPTKEKELESKIEELQASIEQLAEERDSLKDRYLRLAAEMENFRKRTERDLVNRVQNAFSELVRDLLPVLDDLERPLQNRDEAKDYDNLINGLNLILDKFLKILEERGVSQMKAVEAEFDPNLHEAMTQMEAEDKPSGVVIEELEKGYLFNDRVLRPAKVIVSK